jgi:hypothetical protein
MWKTSALAAAALMLAAAPEFFPLRAAPEPKALPAPTITKAVKGTFAPVCRGDEVLDSRPDPKWVGQSYAGDSCNAPALPARLNGATASREQVVAGMAAAKRYAAEAEAFQACVSRFIAARRESRPLTPSQVFIENHRILVSQRAVDTAAGQIKTAIVAFNSYGSDCPE